MLDLFCIDFRDEDFRQNINMQEISGLENTFIHLNDISDNSDGCWIPKAKRRKNVVYNILCQMFCRKASGSKNFSGDGLEFLFSSLRLSDHQCGEKVSTERKQKALE